MKTGNLIALATLLPTSLLADPASVTVKTQSYVCERASQKKVGSGLLVKAGEKVYVLTLAHNVFQGRRDEGICHVISLHDGTTIRTELEAAHYTKDLASLRVLETEKLDDIEPLVFPLEEASLTPKADLSVVGYAFDSNTISANIPLTLRNPKTDRMILPSIKELIEVEGTVELGYSGSGIWDRSGKLQGILLANKITPVEGKKSVTGVIGPKSNEKIVGFAIPTLEVNRWFQEVTENLPSSRLALDVNAQVRQEACLQLGSLRFKGNIRAVFGDGAGVGGEESTRVVGDAVILEIDPQNPDAQSALLRNYPQFERAKRHLLLGSKVQIKKVRKGDDRREVSDVMTLLNYMERGYQPLLEVVESPLVKVDEEKEALKLKASELAKLSEDIRENLKIVSPSDEAALLESLDEITSFIEQGQFEELDVVALRALVAPEKGSRHQQAWNNLMLVENQAETTRDYRMKYRDILRKLEMLQP